jgi:hypothetical protein
MEHSYCVYTWPILVMRPFARVSCGFADIRQRATIYVGEHGARWITEVIRTTVKKVIRYDLVFSMTIEYCLLQSRDQTDVIWLL